MTKAYVGRFAPSPTGPLHLGSLVAALGSWLDARAHHGQWLLRLEDLDREREQAGASAAIVDTLAALGMRADGPVIRQQDRRDHYERALAELLAQGRVFRCSCTRREIRLQQPPGAQAPDSPADPDGGPPYPGTCRQGPRRAEGPHVLRLRVDDEPVCWQDRPAGHANGVRQWVELRRQCGDFALRRADGTPTYQLAVVVDDAAFGVTDVVRGADLASSTARQRLLQTCLGVPHPRTLHLPLVLADDGQKLSKQTGALGVDAHGPAAARVALLNEALSFLQLGPIRADSVDAFMAEAIKRWQSSPWMS
ncbi:MAG: tRNA glutamyl-Q(34) synthetase GluQRS [Burkholderiaceae bacterium]